MNPCRCGWRAALLAATVLIVQCRDEIKTGFESIVSFTACFGSTAVVTSILNVLLCWLMVNGGESLLSPAAP